MGSDPSTWSADRLAAEREARQIQADHERREREKEERKAVKRERDQAKAAVRAERQERYEQKAAVVDEVAAGKREGKYRDIKTVDDNPDKHVDLPPAVGSGKPRKLSKAEKKALKAERKRQKLIAKQRQNFPPEEHLTDEGKQNTTPDAKPYLTEKDKAELSPDARAIIEKQERGQKREGHVDLPSAAGSALGEALEQREQERQAQQEAEALRTRYRKREVIVSPMVASLKSAIKAGLPPEAEDDPDDKEQVNVEFSKHWPDFEKMLDDFQTNLHRSISSSSANRELSVIADKLQISITAFAPEETRAAWIADLDRIRGQL